jgi:copper(I)-binding protein
MDASGMTGMVEMASVEVAAGATVKLLPGGMHLMITGLTRSLKVGEALELDLVFQHAGKIVVNAEVRQG